MEPSAGLSSAYPSSPTSITCPISNLPSEILLIILGYLTSEEMGKATLICKQWKLISEDNSLWKRLFISAFGQLPQKPPGWKRAYKAHLDDLNDFQAFFSNPQKLANIDALWKNYKVFHLKDALTLQQNMILLGSFYHLKYIERKSLNNEFSEVITTVKQNLCQQKNIGVFENDLSWTSYCSAMHPETSNPSEEDKRQAAFIKECQDAYKAAKDNEIHGKNPNSASKLQTYMRWISSLVDRRGFPSILY